MKYKICVTNNIEFIEKGIVMENKYAKEAQQESTEKERLVNYEYKTNFKFEVVKVDKKEHSNELETIIGEFPLALVLNGEYSNTFLCTPENLEQLVAGFLMTKGVIKSKDNIKSIEVDFDNRVAHATIEKNEDLDKGKRFYGDGGRSTEAEIKVYIVSAD